MSAAQDTAIEFQNPEQVVLILVGLVGSGKSTFAQALEKHFPNFRRCNQDELSSRIQVENLARLSLRQGLSVCIDRTNIDATQRSHWINIAREFSRKTWIIVLDTPKEVCASRLRQRTFHPTIKNPEQGLSILSRFASEFQPPTADEGYDAIIYLSPSDHSSPEYDRTDIISILKRLRDAPPVNTQALSSTPHSPRGHRLPPSQRNFRPYRGSGNFSQHTLHEYLGRDESRWRGGPSRATSTYGHSFAPRFRGSAREIDARGGGYQRHGNNFGRSEISARVRSSECQNWRNVGSANSDLTSKDVT